jgi:hypothetical protein
VDELDAAADGIVQEKQMDGSDDRFKKASLLSQLFGELSVTEDENS